jgi:dienelactone hydrolase
MFSHIRVATLVAIHALLILVLVACGGAGPAGTPIPAATTPAPAFVPPTPAYTVEVTKDVDYLRLLEPGAAVQKVDIYAPTQVEPWPVVVLVPGVFQCKESAAYTSLAEELAGRGVVVFVPERRSQSATIIESAHDNGIEFREVSESCACAVRFARERAADFGGDPGRITVFGHGGTGLETALIGDDLGPLWDEFAALHGGPPPQTECLAAGTTARVDAYVTYAGDFHIYEVLKDSDPGLWELTSPHALIGRNPSLPINIVRGEGDAATLLDRAVELHRALVDAGYDATLTMLGTAGTTIPWSGPDREALIQVILEAAGR